MSPTIGCRGPWKDYENRMYSITKITRPASGKVYPRERLFGRLDTCLDRPVVWISAPAGSGKTTLIASYTVTRLLPCIWYRIDRGDGNIASFFYYMGMAAKMAVPGLKKPLPLLTREYLGDISTFTRKYFEYLYGRLEASSVIVFDNYHEIPLESPFNNVIRDGLTELPEGINIILISRDTPPPALARLRASGRMDTLGWNELRLTPEESRGIIKLYGRKVLSEKEIRQAHSRTDGWAAGLILLIESLRTENMRPYPLNRYTPREIFDYFAEVIMNGIDESTQDFLLRTAFLKEITPHLAAQLTGRKDAGEILSGLYAGNYFTERHYHSVFSYRYHPLFREFLLNRALGLYTASGITEIRVRAASLLDQSGDIEEAAALYIDAREWQSLARLITSHAREIIMQGRSGTIQEWISAVPGDITAGAPYLLYWMGVCRMPVTLRESRFCFENAFRLFRESGDRAGLLLSWSGVVETFLHEMGNLRPLDKWISILDGIIGGEPDFPSAEIDAHVTAGMFGAIAVRQPEHPHFDMWKERALSILNTCPDTTLKMLTGFYLHTHCIWTGDYAQSAYIIERLNAIAGSRKASPLARITVKMAETWVWLSGACKSSLSAMSEGLAISGDTGVRIWDYLLMVQGVAASLSSGDLDTAGDLLGKTCDVPERGRLLDRFYHHYETSWYFHLKGNHPRALMHQEKALKLAGETGLHYAEAQSRLAMSHLLHEQARYSESDKHLNRSLRIGRRVKSRSVEYICLLTKAHFSFERGRESSGSANLQKAMALGREQRYVNFSWWHPSFMSALCIKAVERNIETGYVRDIIRQCRLTPDDPSAHIAGWPWPVSIRAFGSFEIMKDGIRLRFPGKTPKKPLEMLTVLIALGGTDVDETRLCDILWPDSDGDAALKSLEITAIRLRKLLGMKETVLYRNGHVTINRRHCHIDAFAFEDLLGKADAVKDRRGDDQYRRYVRQALDLYKGPFISDEAGSWAVSTRERLRDKFIRYTGKLCRLLEKKGNWEEAAARYLRGLEVDDLIEEFYRGIILCYGKLGRIEAVRSMMLRCRETLRSYGMEPSSETEDIYNAVL